MKNKVIISFLTVAVMLVSLAACSGSEPASTAPANDNAAAQSTVEAAGDAVEAATTDEIVTTPAEAVTSVEMEIAAEAETASEASTLALAGAGENTASAGSTAAAEVAADVQMITNGDYVLPVPSEYVDLLIIDTPENSEDGILFSFTEKASVEMAKAEGPDYEGAGWLFDIGKVSGEKAEEMLCEDMSGIKLFAKDADGNAYVLYHPTDVRVVRESYEDLSNGNDPWNKLSEWAANADASFIKENAGLIPEEHTNTELDIYLARIKYKKDVNYTLISLENGEMTPDEEVSLPYLDRLTNGAAFYYADETEAPDGEYIVLSIPEDNVRYDFFSLEEGHNLVREVKEIVLEEGGEPEEMESLYEAVFADGTTTAYDVMSDWYHALVNGGVPGEESTAAEETAEPAPETGP